MKFSIIFFILGLTYVVIGCETNNTNDTYPVCPVKLFRRKRAPTEYTRWRANKQTTTEFIVKILDDELSTRDTKKIVAVNIQPITKGAEKIIIGGAVVTKAASSTPTTTDIKDYTRFVPPTTVVTQVEEDFYLAPISIEHKKGIPMPPRVRNPQRDESPPAGPQFLPRTLTKTALRQYVAITPVGFTRRSTVAPLTPPYSDSYKPSTTHMLPPRTTPLPDVLFPTRTKPDLEEFGNFLPFSEHTDENFNTQSTHNQVFETQSVTEDSTPCLFMKSLNLPPREHVDDYDKKIHGKKDDKNTDISYNMLYHDEDDEGNSQKDKLSTDNYRKKYIYRENSFEIMDTTISEDNTLGRKVDLDKKSEIYDFEQRASDDISSNSTKVNIDLNDAKQKSSKNELRPICSMIKLRQLNFNSPRTLPEIVAQLKQWAENSPVAKWMDITNGNLTTMENPIYMMIIDDPSSGQIISAKQTVMIVAGIQGRDQHAVAAAMYVLYQLIERNEAHADLLLHYRFWIIPVFNPDGYDYAMTFPHRRAWIKNLRQNWDQCQGRESCHSCEAFGLRCTIKRCYGVNLDRNFEYQWIPAEELRTEQPCGPLYSGPMQLSEIETQALTQFLREQIVPLYIFIAFKEGDVLGVMYPNSHTKKKRVNDDVYRQRATRAAAAAKSISGRNYVAGQTSEYLPLYAGGIEDWVEGHLGIDNTYTIIMFRSTDTFNTKLITERVVHEAFAAADTLVLQSKERPSPAHEAFQARRNSSKIVRASTLLIILKLLLLLLFT